MNEEYTGKKKIRFNPVDKIIIVVLLVLTALLGIVGILKQNGISLIDPGLYMYGSFVGVVILLGWGVYAIVRRMKSKGMRLAMGTILSIVVFLIATVIGSYVGLVVNITMPKEFDTVTHGDHKVVILKGYDPDESRQQLRRETRLAENPESSQDFIAEDMGFRYYAYPRVMGVFYRSDADVEGEVYIGYTSQSKLMIEWPDENTARLFVENPGIGEGGDYYLRFNAE